MFKKGFTLIEVLVILAVTTLISSFVISYSRKSQNQIALQVETQKVANLILVAKSAAIATLDTPERKAARDAQGRILCGYGLEIIYSIPQSYGIFSYEPQATNCANISIIRPQDRFSVPVSLLPSSRFVVPAELVLNRAPSACSSPPCNVLHAVLFIPPEPKTLLSRLENGNTIPGEGPYRIFLETADGLARRIIEVSPAGQVDF